MHLRDITPGDAAAILALNETFISVLSPLDMARLEHLRRQASLGRVVEREGRVVAFLLAMREGADYDSPNYRWFVSRYPRFLYVDRIVVAGEAQGAGLGERLYGEAFAHAASHDLPVITCEFDVAPPNPASERFHARLGFREVGRQTLPTGKQVSLQALPTASATSLSRHG